MGSNRFSVCVQKARGWHVRVAGGSGRGATKRKEYTAERYYKPSDEVQDTWDLARAGENLQLAFHIGLQVANTAAIPTWREGDEFKARRDAMMPRR